jgi:hypothetical protein
MFQRFVHRQSYFSRGQLNVQHIPLDLVFEVALGAAGGLLGVPGGALVGSYAHCGRPWGVLGPLLGVPGDPVIRASSPNVTPVQVLAFFICEANVDCQAV